MHSNLTQSNQLYISMETSLDREKRNIPNLINAFKEPGNEAEMIKKMAEGLIEKIRLYCKFFLREDMSNKPISPKLQKKLHKGGMRLFGQFYETAKNGGYTPTEAEFVESMHINIVRNFAHDISQDVLDEINTPIS